MGWRYRKSLNLGKHFRINFSKSGIGYSYGVKGYRVSKTAKGTTRRTFTLPFGMSHVTETKASKPQRRTHSKPLSPEEKLQAEAIWMFLLSVLLIAIAALKYETFLIQGTLLGLLALVVSIVLFIKSRILKSKNKERFWEKDRK